MMRPTRLALSASCSAGLCSRPPRLSVRLAHLWKTECTVQRNTPLAPSCLASHGYTTKPRTPPSLRLSSRKVTPPSKVPLPRRTHSAKAPTVAPPVGVARPYRSAPTPAQEWSPPPRDAPPPPAEPGQGHVASPAGALPPPDSFQVIRAVGGDSLLLYWSPVEDHRISGYQIFVDSQLQLAIRNPQRTKALLPALDLSAPLRLAIRTVSADDAHSALAWADYWPAKATAAH
ncbi:probable pathogenesis-related protein ARB_02861 [Pollicipes pollicipes]|uniref:probable pathogenesis-related protein ARB_02861 n=1 Tax=Pollicipes pollicipes TaxID=41117 RepID=UPI0018849EB5|nr:probable pathogenesis-related protein ARB_02861 [Pollicipes pollicipes]